MPGVALDGGELAVGAGKKGRRQERPRPLSTVVE